MTTFAKIQWWLGSALLGCVICGITFSWTGHATAAHCFGAGIGIFLMEPLRRWGERQYENRIR